MLERLRQVAMLVKDLPAATESYRRSLAMEACHSEDLPQYGLTNVVLPAAMGTFVELLQPTSQDSSAARYLERRGEAPYLLVFETNQLDTLVAHLKSMGVRITEESADGEQRWAFVHPSSANGAFLQIVQVSSPHNPWPPAGIDWERNVGNGLTRQLRQVAVLVRDLDQAVARWSDMFGLRATTRFQISFTDLEIAVLPLAGKDTFLELAQPTSSNTSSARFLARHGEGIYLTIFEIWDSLSVDAHLRQEDIRYTTSRETANYVNLGFNSIWLHPSSMNGAFIQLSQVLHPENPWPPAGDDWYRDSNG